MSSGKCMPGDDPRDSTNAHHWHKTHSLDGCPECYAEAPFDRYGTPSGETSTSIGSIAEGDANSNASLKVEPIDIPAPVPGGSQSLHKGLIR